ncbi:MAG: DNA/RNA non-specific endonuclease [Cyanobacteria bacterium SBLK]|nr:DNA/RNA non-specific endonuclease [Cyanobacteria bacterium SBLK]
MVYELLVAPEGMSIDENGLIQWQTTVEDVGTQTVVVRASDGRGGEDLQTFTLSIVDNVPNRPPLFVSTPVVDAWINQLYEYDATAIDPDGDSLSYRVLLGPEGMVINPQTGEVTWMPQPIVTLGDTVFGQLGLPGEQDEYTFSGTAGQQIYFDPLLFEGAADNWKFKVYSPSGKQLLDTNLENNQLLNLSETGNYRIVLNTEDNSDDIGRYGFKVIDPSLIPTVPFDEVISGFINPGSEDRLYRFTGSQGQKLYFDSLEKNGSLDWVLYDPQHQQHWSPSFTDQETYLPRDGEYILAVRGTGELIDSASYSFEIITPDEIVKPLEGLGDNHNPRTTIGEILEKGEEDFYTFEGTAGQQIYFDYLSHTIGNPTIEIFAPSGESVLSKQSFSSNDTDLLPIVLKEDGTYRVKLNTSQIEDLGSYEFNLLDLELADSLTLDTQINGTLNVGQQIHFYQFEGIEGQHLYFDALTNGGGHWVLYDSGGNIASGYERALNTDIEIVLDNSETYTLAIKGNSSAPLDYAFEVITPDTKSQPLSLYTTPDTAATSTVSQTISEKGERDVYMFVGTSGQRLYFDYFDSDPNLQVNLISPSGTRIISNLWLKEWNSVLTEDGEYQVLIDGSNAATGDYSFRLVDVTNSPLLDIETVEQGTLSPGRSDQFYQFAGSAGERIYFDSQENTHWTNWMLYSPGNESLINSSLVSDFEYVLPSDGIYTLRLHGSDDKRFSSLDSRPYQFQMISTTSPANSLSLNTLVESSLSELGERDVYEFNGAIGQTLYFDPRIGDSKTDVKIHSPSGKEIFFQRNTIGDSSPLTLIESGTYTLTLDGQSDATGDYSFVLHDTQSSPTLPFDTLFEINNHLPRETKLYQFNGSAGQTLDLTSLKNITGLEWVLYAPMSISENKKVVNANNSKLILPTEGTYTLALKNSTDNPISYTAQVDRIFPTPVSQSGTGILYQGTIPQNKEPQIYPISASAGTLLYFNSRGTDSNHTNVRIYNPDGTQAIYSSAAFDLAPILLEQSGNYTLEMRDTPGNYSFQLIDLKNTEVLPLNTKQENITFAPRETKIFRFSGRVGQQIMLDGLNAASEIVNIKILNSSGYLISPSAHVNNHDLKNDVPNHLQTVDIPTLEADGEYYLVLESRQPQSITANFQLVDSMGARSLPLDTDIEGNLGENGRELHFYKFTGTKGQRLYFDSQDGGGSNQWHLYTPGGEVLSPFTYFPNLGSDFEKVLPVDGEYILALRGNGDSNKNYKFRVITPPELPPVALEFENNSLGECALNVTGVISEPGQRNVYEFEGTSNSRLWFDSLMNESKTIKINLYSPSGALVWAAHDLSGDRDPHSDFKTTNTILQETGTYRLEVDGSNDTTGDYQFRLLDFGNAPIVSWDANTNIELMGNLGESGNEIRAYRFNGTQGQLIYPDYQSGAKYRIYTPDGLALNPYYDLSADPTLPLELPSSGEYTVVFREGSDYHLKLVTPEFQQHAYSVGDTLNNTIGEAGEEHFYTFWAEPGQQLRFDSLLGWTDDINTTLYAPSGEEIWQDQDVESDRATTHILDERGLYTLKVDGKGDAVGDYRFRLLDLVDEGDAPLQLWHETTDTIELIGNQERETDIYRFSGEEGELLYLDHQSGSYEYDIYTPEGRSIFSILNELHPRNGSDFSKPLELPSSGEYAIIFPAEGQDYNLRLVTPEISTQSYQVGATASGAIAEPGEEDIYTFEGNPGQKLWFDSLSAQSNSSINATLYAPSGAALFQKVHYNTQSVWNDYNHPLILDEKGTYTLKIDGSHDDTGDYQFRLLDITDAPLVPQESDGKSLVADSLAPLATHVYRFSGIEGQPLYFKDPYENYNYDYTYKVVGPNDEVLVSTDNTHKLVALPQTGEYTLIVENPHGTDSKGYNLEIIAPEWAEQSLQLGAKIAGEIQDFSEKDTYTFTGSLGQKLFFSGLGDNIKAALHSPSRKIADLGDGLALTLQEPGEYRLVVEGTGDEITGQYEFILSDRDRVPSLEFETSMQGQLNADNKVDLYRFEGKRGEAIDFTLESIAAGATQWIVYDPDSKEIARGEGENFTAVLPARGLYTLAVVREEDSPVDYAFAATVGEPETATFTNDINRAISGFFGDAEPDSYTLKAKAGTQIFFNFDSSWYWSTAKLINPDGTTTVFNVIPHNGRISSILEQTGEYKLELSGSGSYSFESIELPESVRGANYLEMESQVSGSLNGRESKVYTFEGVEGLRLLLNGIEGNNVSATLYKPNGDAVFSQRTNVDVDRPYTLTEDGLYHLVVTGETTGTNPYRFQLLDLSGADEIDLNLPVSGTLPVGEKRAYQFSAEEGQTLFYNALSNAPGKWILYYAGNDRFIHGRSYGGDIINQSINTDFETELPYTGDYVLVFDSETSTVPVEYEFQLFTHEKDEVTTVVTPGTGDQSSSDRESQGLISVKLETDDGRGGRAEQDYQIRLWPDPNNSPPAIVSLPEERFSLTQDTYRYQVISFDSDNDNLTYRLVEAPLGAVIDRDSGELLWFPTDDVVAGERVDFTVEVDDGRGGSDRQSFSVNPYDELGSIRGAVFEDLNGNGLRDTQLIQGDNPALIVAFDTSGSTAAPFAGPDGVETVLDAQIAATRALVNSLIAQGLGDSVNIGLIPHNNTSVIHDWDADTPGLQYYTTPLADRDNNLIPDIQEYLDGYVENYIPRGSTELNKALDDISELVGALSATSDPNVIFMSDGYDEDFDPEAAATAVADLESNGVNISAFAIGPYSTVETLRAIDPEAPQLLDVEELVRIMGGWDEDYAIEPLMEGVTVYLDENNNGILDEGEPWQVTRKDEGTLLSEGSRYYYNFDNLIPDDNKERVLRTIVPDGFVSTLPASGAYQIILDEAEGITQLFGLHDEDRNSPNQDPIFMTIAPEATLKAGEQLIYRANAIDPNADVVTYELALEPEGMAVDPDTGIVIWSPTEAQIEKYYDELYQLRQRLEASGRGDFAPETVKFDNILLLAKDGLGGQALQTLSVELTAPNRIPVFTANFPEDAEPQVGKPFYYQATALDADGDDLTYTVVSGNNATFINPETGQPDATSEWLRWIPNEVGETEMTIKVSDGRGGKSTQTLKPIAIEPRENNAPILESQPRSGIRLGSPYFYKIEASDPDGDILTYSWEDPAKRPDGMEMDEQGRIAWTPTAAQFGTHPVAIKVSDGEKSIIQSWEIDVFDRAVNNPPAIVSIPETLTNLEKIYQYQPEGFDPDGDYLIWSIEESPSGMAIDPETGVMSWQPSDVQVGEHNIILRVTDANGAASEQEFILAVNGTNTPPTIISTPLTQGSLQQPYIYQAIATDADGDAITYRLNLAPEGMAIDENTGEIQWTPETEGSYQVEILALDASGGGSAQAYAIEVEAEALNHAPEILPPPLSAYTADTKRTYTYEIKASDPDGDALAYQLINADSLPSDIYLNGNILTWDNPVVGEYNLVIGVDDGQLGAAQGFSLRVYDNQPPNIIENAPDTAIADVTYRYDVRATDPEGGKLTYQLDTAPNGMAIDEKGRIDWTPEDAEIGKSHTVTVAVADEAGATSRYTYTVTVGNDSEDPKVVLQPLNNVYVVQNGENLEYQADPNSTIAIRAVATDDIKVEGLQLLIDGEPVLLDGNGIATVTVGASGAIFAEAIAIDGAKNEDREELYIQIVDPDAEAPNVSLSGDNLDGVIDAAIEIQGMVESEGLREYVLEIAPVSGGEFREIARGDTNASGTLGTLDPELFLNDSYVLRLRAKNEAGKTAFTEEIIEIGTTEKRGNFALSFTDLLQPFSGVPVNLERTYDTLASHVEGNLGYGWRLNLVDTDLRTSLPPDPQAELLGLQVPFQQGTRVHVTLPDGKRESFTFRPRGHSVNKFINGYLGSALGNNSYDVGFYYPQFIPDPGNTSQLTVQDNIPLQRVGNKYYSHGAGQPYNPASGYFGGRYTLTTADGVAYNLNGKTGALISATGLNGEQITFQEDGVFSSTGEKILFQRDPQGRITGVSLPEDDPIVYSNEDGDLISAIDGEQKTSTFVYKDGEPAHQLDKVIDEDSGQVLYQQTETGELNRPPFIDPPESFLTHRDLQVPIDLTDFIIDADGDPIEFELSNPLNGTIALGEDGKTAYFYPTSTDAEYGYFDVSAKDGEGSNQLTVTVRISDAPLLNLDFVERNPQLDNGESTELVVIGDFADQEDVVLPDSYLTYISEDPAIADLSETGWVTGDGEGATVLKATRDGITAVTAIRVGEAPDAESEAEVDTLLAEAYGLEVYPEAVTLVAGTQRPLLVGIEEIADSPDLKLGSGDTPTRYFVSNPDILQVSDDGIATALAEGLATVTVIHGGTEEVIPIRVDVPETGPVQVGSDGGAVRSAEGALVTIAPESLSEEITVNIEQIADNEISLPLPEQFELAGSFTLDVGDDPLAVPAQIAIPASEGQFEPGTEVFFLRKVELPDENGVLSPIWMLEDSGTIGEDGNIRTSSPPWQGVKQTGEYAIAVPKVEYKVYEPRLNVNYVVAGGVLGFVAFSHGVASALLSRSPEDLIDNELIDGGLKLYKGAMMALLQGDASHSTEIETSIDLLAIPTLGLPYKTEADVSLNLQQLDEGEIPSVTLETPDLPDFDDPTPLVEKVELQFDPNYGRVVYLEIANFDGSLSELSTQYYFGGKVYEGEILTGLSELDGENKKARIATIADGVPFSESKISLERTIRNPYLNLDAKAKTEAIAIPTETSFEYALIPQFHSDAVSVINALDPDRLVASGGSHDLLLANIPVGNEGVQSNPKAIAVTGNGSRAYVTLETAGSIAVIGVNDFKQLEVIDLPPGATPGAIAIAPHDQYAYIADSEKGSIYILDINPTSGQYNQLIDTIFVGDSLKGIKDLALSNDGKRLFATVPEPRNSQDGKGKILVFNADIEDRPVSFNNNARLWHQQIGAIETERGLESIASTPDAEKMTFTTSKQDFKGYGVLSITNNNPLAFAAETNYSAMGLGYATDYFDVNEVVASEVIYHEGTQTHYAFVAGRNERLKGKGFPSIDAPGAGSNIGIIKDALSDNPKLIGATRPIPDGAASDLSLSSDGKFLYATYPGAESTFVFDVEEAIATVNSYPEDLLESRPIDDINPNISIAADLKRLEDGTYGVPEGSNKAPISQGGSGPISVAMASKRPVLSGEVENTDSTHPSLTWKFEEMGERWKNLQSLDVFVSTFPEGEGLFPWEQLSDLSDPSFLPDLSEDEKRALLTKRWKGYDDFNPGRILTASWEPQTQTWVGYDGESELSLPEGATANSDSRLTLPEESALTNGQEYYWGIRAVNSQGEVETFTGDFNTRLSTPVGWESPFSSVTVLTHGFSFLYNETGISKEFRQMANAVADSSGKGEDERGLVLRYHKETGYWVPTTAEGDFVSIRDNGGTRKLKPTDENYLEDLHDYITQNFINQDKPLVILPEWATGGESKVADTGFSEAAADAFYASLVSLDQLLGGDVGERNNDGEVVRLYDDEGDLIRKHGAIFDSPLHFVGHSRGTVVNSEIIQRLGTDFPEAGGKQESGQRDLQMTTLDPHDFRQESLRLPLLDYRDFYEPEVRVWENVTFADNYYQTVGGGLTPNGREIDEADVNMSFNGLPGFEEEIFGIGGPHMRILDWYFGTMDLDEEKVSRESWDLPGQKPLEEGRVYDQLGEESVEDLLSGAIPDEMYWYNAGGSSEGIGTGWFYSVQGGGDRPLLAETERTEVSYDNTHEDVVRGDDPIPAIFNGNFDVGLSDDPNAPVPGWSFHSRSKSNATSPTPPNGVQSASSNPDNIQEENFEFESLRQDILLGMNTYEPLENYRKKLGLDISEKDFEKQDKALFLQSDTEPVKTNSKKYNEGVLRFDLFSEEKNPAGELKVSIEYTTKASFKGGVITPPKTVTEELGKIQLSPARNNTTNAEERKNDLYRLGYAINRGDNGNHGFETFHLPLADKYKGKTVSFIFETQATGGKQPTPLLLDNVAIQSKNLKFGNPTKAKYTEKLYGDQKAEDFHTNLLLEKPQYVVSYNAKTGIPNWVSWELNKTWIGKGRPDGAQFLSDKTLPQDWPHVNGDNYTKVLKDKDGNPVLDEKTKKEKRISKGHDRGHLTPNGDRNRNSKDALITFLGTNIIPQSIDNNRLIIASDQIEFQPPTLSSAWFNVENMSRNLVKDQDKELYIVAGGLGNRLKTDDPRSNMFSHESEKTHPTELTFTNPDPTKDTTQIYIPRFTWKTMLAIDSPNMLVGDVKAQNATIYTFLTPNIPEPPKSTNWSEGVQHPFEDPNMKFAHRTISEWLNLKGQFDDITSLEQWRSPSTWQISADQLEHLLQNNSDDNFKSFKNYWDMFSKLPENTQNTLEREIEELPQYKLEKDGDPQSYVFYSTPEPQPLL